MQTYLKAWTSKILHMYMKYVCLRLSQFSQSSFSQYIGLCDFSLPNYLVMTARMCIISYHHHHLHHHHFGFWMRQRGFRSLTQVCCGISISNSLCVLFVAMGRSIDFQICHFKMAAWGPYWMFWFPDSNFSLAFNIYSKLQWHIPCVYGWKPIDFQRCQIQDGRLVAIFDALVSDVNSLRPGDAYMRQ